MCLCTFSIAVVRHTAAVVAAVVDANAIAAATLLLLLNFVLSMSRSALLCDQGQGFTLLAIHSPARAKIAAHETSAANG